jgi:hypothetical protein
MRWVFIVGGCAAVLLVIAFAATTSQGPLGFQSRSQPTVCLKNLRMLDGAKTQFAIEHHGTNGEIVSMADLSPYLHSTQVTCPAGGQYELRAIGKDPLCSLGTNKLSWRHDRILSYTFSADSGNMHRLAR